jgi:putative hemolysin
MYKLILLFCYCIALSGCATAAAELLDNQADKMANPAVTKCLKEGLNTEPQIMNGVPKTYICIDPKNGERCEAWTYFRGECTFVKP